MRGPAHPGLVILSLSFMVLVAALALTDRTELTDTSRRGFPMWFLLLVMFACCCAGVRFGWRGSSSDDDKQL